MGAYRSRSDDEDEQSNLCRWKLDVDSDVFDADGRLCSTAPEGGADVSDGIRRTASSEPIGIIISNRYGGRTKSGRWA